MGDIWHRKKGSGAKKSINMHKSEKCVITLENNRRFAADEERFIQVEAI